VHQHEDRIVTGDFTLKKSKDTHVYVHTYNSSLRMHVGIYYQTSNISELLCLLVTILVVDVNIVVNKQRISSKGEYMYQNKS